MRGVPGGPSVRTLGIYLFLYRWWPQIPYPDKLAQQHRKVNPPNTCTRAHARVRVLSVDNNMAHRANIPHRKPSKYNGYTIILVNRIKKAPPDRRGKVAGRKTKYLE
mgnify:CR=1 FL=1